MILHVMVIDYDFKIEVNHEDMWAPEVHFPSHVSR